MCLLAQKKENKQSTQLNKYELNRLMLFTSSII